MKEFTQKELLLKPVLLPLDPASLILIKGGGSNSSGQAQPQSSNSDKGDKRRRKTSC